MTTALPSLYPALPEIVLAFGAMVLLMLGAYGGEKTAGPIGTVAFLTRKGGWQINRLTVLTSVLYAILLVCFVVATKMTTAANAIFLQYTAPIYIMIFEPVLFKENWRWRDAITVAICMAGMSLFFVGHLRVQDLTGNAFALISGVAFAFYLLLLRHPRSQAD